MSYMFVINGQQTLRTVRDITLSIRPLKEVLSNVTLYDTYAIQDGDTPEIISELLYGTPYYHWIIMLVNEKYDYLNDFPLDNKRLQEYVTAKYGEGNEHAQHYLFGRKHYVSPEGYIVDEGKPGAVAVTNSEYEFNKNEENRYIKVVNAKYVATFVKDLNEAFKSNV